MAARCCTCRSAATTALTALLAAGGAGGFALAARWLGRGADPYRLAGVGALAGIVAFSAVIFSAPLGSALLFAAGVVLIGFGGGLFAARHADRRDGARAAPGESRAGARRLGRGAGDGRGRRHRRRRRRARRRLGAGRQRRARRGLPPRVGYGVVYHIEIALLFATLVAIGPLVRTAARRPTGQTDASGWPTCPGYADALRGSP